MSRAYLRPRPGGQHERLRRQRAAWPLARPRRRPRPGGALQRQAGPPACDLRRPADGPGLHRLQRREALPRQNESRTYGIGRSTCGLSRGFTARGGVDQAAVVLGELGIGPVDLRVVEVGLVDPGLSGSSGTRRAGTPPKNANASTWHSVQARCVHLHHRADEHVPRAGQHHHERPDRPHLPRHRIEPASQNPVVDLRLLARLGRARAPDRHLRPAGLPPARTPPRNGGSSRRSRPGPARRAAARGSSTSAPRPSAAPRTYSWCSPIAGQVTGSLSGQSGTTPGTSSGHSPSLFAGLPRVIPAAMPWVNVLADRLPVHPSELLHIVAERPASVPVHEDLGYVDHVETSPARWVPVFDGRQHCLIPRARPTTTRTPSPHGGIT